MTVIYPINGRNERMGRLFKTPKHLLLYKGVPAITLSTTFMKEFGTVKVLLGNYPEVPYVDNIKVTPTDNPVDTIKQFMLKDNFFIVDCDIIPFGLNPPQGNTVYLFKNENQLTHYSNFKVENGLVVDCNEKGEVFDWAGAGIYFFRMNDDFYQYSVGAKSVSEIIRRMVRDGKKVHADTTSKIFRFGTLEDILCN